MGFIPRVPMGKVAGIMERARSGEVTKSSRKGKLRETFGREIHIQMPKICKNAFY